MKVASFFSGIGGIDLAFRNAGFEIVFANDNDAKCCITYEANHPNPIICEDIAKIQEIPNIEILTAGFPCQSFSIAGYRKGFADANGNTFFDLLNIIKRKHPNIVFLENVKNLLTHNNGKTFQAIYNSLKYLKYNIAFKVVNTRIFCKIPQNREELTNSN